MEAHGRFGCRFGRRRLTAQTTRWAARHLCKLDLICSYTVSETWAHFKVLAQVRDAGGLVKRVLNPAGRPAHRRYPPKPTLYTRNQQGAQMAACFEEHYFHISVLVDVSSLGTRGPPHKWTECPKMFHSAEVIDNVKWQSATAGDDTVRRVPFLVNPQRNTEPFSFIAFI